MTASEMASIEQRYPDVFNPPLLKRHGLWFLVGGTLLYLAYTVWFFSLPQVLPNFMSYTLLRLEINVRASTIIGAVGGGGIGEELKLSISRGFGAKTVALVLLLFVTIVAVDQFSAWLRRRLVGEHAFLLQH